MLPQIHRLRILIAFVLIRLTQKPFCKNGNESSKINCKE